MGNETIQAVNAQNQESATPAAQAQEANTEGQKPGGGEHYGSSPHACGDNE